jgi:uncharacterized SAM-binding protein YcdF (DUF218 family)
MTITAKTNKPDVVIVLANQMDINGVLNLESKARAEKAVVLLKEQEIPKIVTCGWAYRSDSNIRIADAFKTYIVDNLGINPQKIITEINSRDTVGDAYFTKINLALALGWKKIWVVTSDYHVPRAQEIFNFIYGTDFEIAVIGAAVSKDDSILRNEVASTHAFRQTFLGVEIGNHSQIIARLRERHPFYNGQVYSRI